MEGKVELSMWSFKLKWEQILYNSLINDKGIENKHVNIALKKRTLFMCVWEK